MRKQILALVSVVLISACGSGQDSRSATAPRNADEAAQQMVSLLNSERSSREIGTLSLSSALTAAAQIHANDMASRRYFSHMSPEGSTPQSRVAMQNYNACVVAENISKGHETTTATFRDWMNSPGHRDNNLRETVSEIGVGFAPGDYWVLLFAKPGC